MVDRSIYSYVISFTRGYHCKRDINGIYYFGVHVAQFSKWRPLESLACYTGGGMPWPVVVCFGGSVFKGLREQKQTI